MVFLVNYDFIGLSADEAGSTFKYYQNTGLYAIFCQGGGKTALILADYLPNSWNQVITELKMQQDSRKALK